MKTILILCTVAALLLAPGGTPSLAMSSKTPQAASCPPTQEDALGPFYKPNAPIRSQIGAGYLLTGAVKSSRDCTPIAQARIELWMTGPNGRYGDAYRATMFSDRGGTYRFESHAPLPYAGRPPHIHIRVTADGFAPLITQHYPKKGRTEATFDLVLIPAR